MSAQEGNTPRRTRSRRTFFIEVVVLSAVLLGVYMWQHHSLLPTDAAAPVRLDQGIAADPNAERTVIYFFAPWCTWCRLSMPALRSALADHAALRLVALDYASPAEVQRMLAEVGLDDVPVILGNRELQREWQVHAYPTYYVLDREQRIRHRSVGYTAPWALWWRSR